jgi:hypothetical protein
VSKYSKYLERGLQKIKYLENEINSSKGPDSAIRRLADIYLKDAQMTKYFEKYRDKGSGRENYLDFLKAKGKYSTGNKKIGREDKEMREIRLVGEVEGKFLADKEFRKRFWKVDDWRAYEAFLRGSFGNLFSGDFFLNPW